MGMVIDSGFANQTITFLNKQTIQKADYTIESTYVEGKSYQACVYSKTLGMNYFSSGLWKEDTLFIAMIDYTADRLHPTDRIRWNGTDYAIDYIDDIASQHEAIFIGLRAVK